MDIQICPTTTSLSRLPLQFQSCIMNAHTTNLQVVSTLVLSLDVYTSVIRCCLPGSQVLDSVKLRSSAQRVGRSCAMQIACLRMGICINQGHTPPLAS